MDGFSSLSSPCDPSVCEDGASGIGWALGHVDPMSDVATSRHVTMDKRMAFQSFYYCQGEWGLAVYTQFGRQYCT